jgi:hypothetical protein
MWILYSYLFAKRTFDLALCKISFPVFATAVVLRGLSGGERLLSVAVISEFQNMNIATTELRKC